jgi:hypothetical protein
LSRHQGAILAPRLASIRGPVAASKRLDPADPERTRPAENRAETRERGPVTAKLCILAIGLLRLNSAGETTSESRLCPILHSLENHDA